MWSSYRSRWAIVWVWPCKENCTNGSFSLWIKGAIPLENTYFTDWLTRRLEHAGFTVVWTTKTSFEQINQIWPFICCSKASTDLIFCNLTTHYICVTRDEHSARTGMLPWIIKRNNQFCASDARRLRILVPSLHTHTHEQCDSCWSTKSHNCNIVLLLFIPLMSIVSFNICQIPLHSHSKIKSV